MNARPASVVTLERYVDAPELAELMGVSTSTIKRWRLEGMPSQNWGMKRTRRYLPSVCIAWAQARAVPDTIASSWDCDGTAPGQRQPKE